VTRAAPPAVQVVGSDGRELRRYGLPGDRARGPLAVAGGVGLAGTTRGDWGLDPTTGERRWRLPGAPAAVRPDPRETATAVEGRVVVVDGRGGVTAVDAGGERAWRVAVPGGADVVAGDGERGRVYAAGERGLYALRG
jgi:outer membrane protein assembly factor BamB